jgi:hypothetical protein
MLLDKSADEVNLAQLLVYLLYCYDGGILEDFLFCESLEGRITGEEFCDLVDKFLELSGLLWFNCVAICADGAAALTGVKEGFTGRVKDVAPHVIFQHCMIHREALVGKKLQPDINKILQDAVSTVNFIKLRVLKSRLFKILCN